MYAIRSNEHFEIITPFLFDNTVDQDEAKETCEWWLDHEYPNDELGHTTAFGSRPFKNRVIGQVFNWGSIKKKDGSFILRKVEPIWHFKGMCKT